MTITKNKKIIAIITTVLAIISTTLIIIYYSDWFYLRFINPNKIEIEKSILDYDGCKIEEFELTMSDLVPKNSPNLTIWGDLKSNCDINLITLMDKLNLELLAYSTCENNVYYLSPGAFVINPKGHFWKKGIGLGAEANDRLSGIYFDIYIILTDKKENRAFTVTELPKYYYLQHFQVQRP